VRLKRVANNSRFTFASNFETYPETDSDRIPRGFRAPHSDRSDETIKGKQSECYMAMSKFSDQISALQQLALEQLNIKIGFFQISLYLN
jgi:hypothetical protein